MIRKCAIAAIAMLLLAAPCAAQTHFSMGLFNAGKIAEEKTHHVRLGGMGRDVYFGIGIDKHLVGHTAIAIKATYMPTQLAAWPCDTTPCEQISRYDHRPHGDVKSYPMSWTTVGAGLHQSLGVAHVAAGASLNIVHAGDVAFLGAQPMLTIGGWLEAHLEVAGVGIEAGASVIPPQPARYTVYDEIGGGKTNGAPYTEKPETITALYVGARIRAF